MKLLSSSIIMSKYFRLVLRTCYENIPQKKEKWKKSWDSRYSYPEWMLHFLLLFRIQCTETLVAVLGWQGDQVVSALDSQSGGPSSKCRSDFTSCICLSSIPRSTPWPRLWKADWLPPVIVVFNLIIDVFFTLYFPNYLSGVLVNFNSGQKKF